MPCTMARAIADSDDDEEEIYTELDDVDARANGAGQGGNAAHGEAAMNGSNERSTGSTGMISQALVHHASILIPLQSN